MYSFAFILLITLKVKRMKRISFLILTILMACTMSMAQGNRRGGERKVDPKERAERMTDRMAKEYSLNDTQKQKLYEVNLAMVESMKEAPAMHHKRGHQGKKAKCDANCQCKKDANAKCTCDNCKKQPKMTKEERDKLHNQIKEKRTAYNTKVKEIMTEDQYKAFTKKQADRQERTKLRKARS